MADHVMQLQSLADSLLQRMAGQSVQPSAGNAPAPESRRPEPEPNDRLELTQTRMYQLKFDFFYEKVVQSSRQATLLEENQSRTLTQNLYQRVSARFSLDLSFISRLAVQTGRAASIDREVFQQFTEAAQGLTQMDEKSFRQFVQSVDTLFNAVETALGLSEDGLDDFAEVVKSAAAGFFEMVKNASQRLDDREKLAAMDFRNQVRRLLEPEPRDRGLMRDIRKLLRESGLPDDQKKELLRLFRLIVKYAKKAVQDGNRQFIDRVRELLDRYEKPDAPADTREKPQAVPARLVEMYERTEVREQIRVQVQEQSLNVMAA